MAGIYAADGSTNVTVVDGTTLTGLYAADGSFNVVVSKEISPIGVYAPCGALNVTLVTEGNTGRYAPDGSLFVTESPYGADGAIRVTAVTGSLGFRDTFTRADETLESSDNWTRIDGVAGAAGVRSNKLALLSATPSAYSCPDISSSDMYVQARLYTTTFTPGNICARLTDKDNFVCFRNNTNTLQVYKSVAGSATVLASSIAFSSGDMIRLECSGDTVRLLVNGVQKLAPTSLAGSFSTITKAGIRANSSTPNPWIDNFSAGPL